MTIRSGYKPPKRNSAGASSIRGGKRKNARSTISKLSDFTYDLNKTLRDVNALQKGKVGARIERRILGNLAAQGLGSKFLKLFFK